jgi:hypothetical protein
MDQARLFRTEVMEAHAGRWLGSARLAQSIPFWVGCLIAITLAFSFVAYGVFGTYTRKAHVYGILALGGSNIVSSTTNRATLNYAQNLHHLVAHLYAPSQTASFVTIGQTVTIRYAAYPYQKFGLQSGKVISISKSTFSVSSLPLALKTQRELQDKQALYRVTVALDAKKITAHDKALQLVAGMTLEADIVQGKRTIIEWIFMGLKA